MQRLIERAKELLENGTVARVVGWKEGILPYMAEPAFFETPESLNELIYNEYCSANLSKYMIQTSKMEGKTLVFLKPCDTYSFNQLLLEHRVDREKTYIIGVGCSGKKEKNELLERCHVCKGKEHKIYDEIIGESQDTTDRDRFVDVEALEAMSAEERFAFFQKEFSKCIRCNACRNVCPVCSCRKCVFDGNAFASEQKANVDSFEEKMFHVIRAYHVAGRCTDCGECSRVCPQGIPLHLLNRRLIKDMNELYGEFQAGADSETKGPLISFTMEDAEPSIIEKRG